MKVSIESIVKFIPVIEKPPFRPSFKEKLKWTLIALGIYFVLSQIEIAGMIRREIKPALEAFSILIGSRIGTLMTLGIGPIITAGIILELLVGSKMIKWDLKKPEDRAKFESWNKFLAVFFSFLEAFAYVMSGAIPLKPGFGVRLLATLQIAMGSITIILLDDLIKKWGIGSGISLFILAGVSSRIFITLFSPFVYSYEQQKFVLWFQTNSIPSGKFLAFLVSLTHKNFSEALVYLLPVITTFLIIVLAAYVQDIRIDIPIAYSLVRGFGRPWSLRLLYTSTVPVIFAFALLSNLQLIARANLVYENGLYCGPLGCYDRNYNPVSGAIYFLTLPRTFLFDAIAGKVDLMYVIRIIVYSIIFLSLCVLFSIFWVETSGMDPESIAEQFSVYGFQIPGYRRDKRIISEILKKYISPLSSLSGLFMGLLAIIADLFSALGTGTGLLLAVTISYNYYQLIKMERSEDIPEFLRKIVKE